MRLCPLELAAAISLLFFALAGDTSASPTAQSLRTVILDYATYEGYYNGTYDLNIWKGYVRRLPTYEPFRSCERNPAYRDSFRPQHPLRSTACR